MDFHVVPLRVVHGYGDYLFVGLVRMVSAPLLLMDRPATMLPATIATIANIVFWLFIPNKLMP